MAKKNRKKNPVIKIFENTEIESAEANVKSTGSVKGEGEAILPESIPQVDAAEVSTIEEPSVSEESDPALTDTPTSNASVSPKEETSADELLGDVRRSLIEDETLKTEKQSKKWWRRGSKGKKDKNVEPEKPIEAEVKLPPVSASTDLVKEQGKGKDSEEYLDELDELIDTLETETIEDSSKKTASVEVMNEPEVKVDLEELKKQAFQTRASDDKQEDISEIRSIALQGGEEVFVEVQSTRQDPLEERVTAFENALRPYRRYIYLAIAVLGAVMVVITGIVLINLYQRIQPPQPAEEVVILPHPVAMSLPGGLNFNLSKGTLEEGEWNPRGPEWLEGTEICRWVAIPWSRQLEAVIRTLNPNDPIELVMSNNDKLVYKVYSVRQLSNEELQKVDTNSPCLLLVLAVTDSEKRWVLTALP